MSKIPIVIFAYNRPSHFKRVMISLQNNKINNKIYLILDGPKNKKDIILQKDILGSIETVGKYNKFKKNQFTVFKNTKNLGLAKSISKGLDKISKLHENFIVLEDDVVPYKNMVPFFSNCIKKYKNEKKVAAICGYQFFSFEKNSKILETKILKHFIPWGWATWSKNWREFRKKNKKIILKINNKNPKFINLLQKNLIKKGNYKNYWSLNFMTYNYSKNYHYIFPNNSLVKNIGFDGSGTNSHTTNDLYVIEKNVNRIRYNEVKFYKPDIIKQEKLLKKVFKNFYN
jgi:hypothetical protein